MALREARAALKRAAIVARAEAKGIRWTKNHAEEARLAGQLFSDGILSTDVEERLIQLNTLRKDVAYGEPGPELEELDLEGLAAELEEFLEEVEQLIDALGKKG